MVELQNPNQRENGWVCANCGTFNHVGHKFCSQCGAFVDPPQLPKPKRSCQVCGRIASESDKFCIGCGSELLTQLEQQEGNDQPSDIAAAQDSSQDDENLFQLQKNVEQVLLEIKDYQHKIWIYLPELKRSIQSLQVDHLAETRVKDIDMPFFSMVIFMVKWAIASIPAAIILIVLGAIFWACIGTSLLGLISEALRNFSL